MTTILAKITMFVGAALFATLPSARAELFTVTSTVDAVDANPGDGKCATAANQCALRAAIQESNALPGHDEIVVPGATYTLTIPGINEDAAATGDLDITDDLTIHGAGANATIVDGGGLDRVFHMPGVAIVTIRGLTVRNGNVAGTGNSGGGIFNGLENRQGGLLKLISVTVIGNAAAYGGGIMNGWGASAVLEGVTVNGNTAAYGAGLYTRDAGTVLVANSTFSDNSASGGGGGVDSWSQARLLLTNVTIANNSGLMAVESTGSLIPAKCI